MNERQELHDLLLRNPALLPGEQIDPDAPRRWLVIKHEMPVSDPATGASRWSLDLLFADQFGIPTLIECKRCDDTQSRRQVVAQMLEYAANGQHYWTAAEMQKCAERTHGSDLQRKLDAIRGKDGQSVEEFFELVQQNLRESKMRLVFFLEESPNELRSIVDFMNKQLKDTEVYLVEARQYQHGNDRIVVPWLFGFTEEARVAKRESRAQTMRASGDRGEEAFWRALEASNLPDYTRDAMRKIVEDWSTGSLSAYGRVWFGVSAIFVLRHAVETRGLFAVTRHGSLEMYFGYWDEAKYPDIGNREIKIRDDFIMLVETTLGINFSDHQRRAFPKVAAETWVPKEKQLRHALEDFLGRNFPIREHEMRNADNAIDSSAAS